MSRKTVVQLTNSFIQEQKQQRFYAQKEQRKRNHFMGWVFILVILLFILPTYNLVKSYQTLLKRRDTLTQLHRQHQKIVKKKKFESAVARKLHDSDYAAKFARARYFYSKNGEFVYTVPNLLPK